MTTTGMAENYNANSKYQEDVFDFSKPILATGLNKTQLPDSNKAFAIADYGCSHGQNSVRAVKFIIETIFKRNNEQPILVVHNDLPTNDFNKVFQNIYQSPESYLKLRSGGIWPLCSGASFYQPILPASSIHCGISASAAHWVSKIPTVHFAEGVFLSQAKGEVVQAILKIAEEDWLTFLTARAEEIASGGLLFIQIVGRRRDARDPKLQQVTSADLFVVINEILLDLIKKKYLRQEVYNKFIFPVVPRSLEEALLPIKGDLKKVWECEHASVDEVDNPYLRTFQRNGNLIQYTNDYIGFTKAFTESTLNNYLFIPGAMSISPAELNNYFYAQLKKQIETHPETGIYHAYMLTLLLRRTEGELIKR